MALTKEHPNLIVKKLDVTDSEENILTYSISWSDRYFNQ